MLPRTTPSALADDDENNRAGAARTRHTASVAAAFTYPSVDPGIPALGVDELLAAHADLLARTKVCYGATREVFEHDVMTLVRRYAAFVHLLPATPSDYFNVPGGLLQLGLETAFFALQGTDAHIFSGRAPISTRQHLEPRWRLATYIAGLCAEVHRTLGQVIVTDHAGNEWPPYLQGLEPWLSQYAVPRYYLKWIPNAPETPGIALFALQHVVPAATLQHLAQGNRVVVLHMLASLSAMPLVREHNVVAELVRRSAALVIDRNLRASADRYGRPQLGSHLERYLVDALRRLVVTNASWLPNAERSRVWYGRDGLFIVWPNAAVDLRKLLEADQLPGVPKAPETMLEILLGADVFEAQPDGKPLWTIAPPGAKAALEAIKLSAPALVLAGLEPRPDALPDALAVPATAARPAAAQAPAGAAEREAPRPKAAAPRPSSPDSQADELRQVEPPVGPAPTTAPEPAAEPATDTGHRPAGEQYEASTAPVILREPPSGLQSPTLPLSLHLPMRLPARLRAALVSVVEALESSIDPPLARLIDSGLFIALAEFERRHVDPSLALRTLAEARMLATDANTSAPSSTCTIGGQNHLGLTIAPTYVAGGRAAPGSSSSGH